MKSSTPWHRIIVAFLALTTVGLPLAVGQAAKAPANPTAETVDAELLKKAAAARTRAEQAAALKNSLEMSLSYYANQIKTLADMAQAAVDAVNKANAEKAAAEKALAQTNKDNAVARAAAEKLLAEKTAALKLAVTRASMAKTNADRFLAAKANMEKQLTDRIATLQPSLTEAAEAEAAALGGLKPLSASAWDYAKARHLLLRAGFGGTPEEVARLHALGLHLAVDSLLNFNKTPPLILPFDAVLPERPGLDEKYRTPQEVKNLELRRRSAEFMQMQKLRQWWFQRMLQSPRPLQEKLTLFWHGHFTSQFSIVQNTYAMYQQNELFRQHAAGNFGALLHGIVHDPAMLRYLDNNTNVRGKANENLARELMELFSMGEGRGYTEKDIMEGARALTGYTFDPYACQFRFLVSQHDPTPKTIFGKTGPWTGDDFVDLILHQPATSRFIASKLFAYFAHEKPAPETVERLARVLRLGDYELTPLLRNLFLSEEFYSPKAMGTQIKSPVQLMVGLYRELGLKSTSFQFQSQEYWIRSMGQDLFEPPNVRGWEGGRSWINANVLITRYNTIASLVDRPVMYGLMPPVQFGRPVQTAQYLDLVEQLRGKDLKTPADIVDCLARRHLVVPLAAEKRQELIAYLGNLAPSSQWADNRNVVNAKLRGLLVLLLASPEYQMT